MHIYGSNAYAHLVQVFATSCTKVFINLTVIMLKALHIVRLLCPQRWGCKRYRGLL